MDKPDNPYKKESQIWAVMEGDWEDLMVSQIAEVLDTTPNNIFSVMNRIKNKTGYVVPYVKMPPGRKRRGDYE